MMINAASKSAMLELYQGGLIGLCDGRRLDGHMSEEDMFRRMICDACKDQPPSQGLAQSLASCKDSEKVCSVNKYDPESFEITGEVSLVCVGMGMPCPCGDMEHKCPGEDFCRHKIYDPCPCEEGSMTCYNVSYNAQGEPMDLQQHCTPANGTCACGTGSLPNACPDGDEDGERYFLCYPASQGTCPAKQFCEGATPKPCYTQKYMSTTTASEPNWEMEPTLTCVAADSCCPCTDTVNELECTDANIAGCTANTYCVPKFYYPSCPVSCTTAQQRCPQLVYNTDGTLAMITVDGEQYPQFTEVCAASDSACPCVATHEIA